jgi:LacI family transcriptional regulator
MLKKTGRTTIHDIAQALGLNASTVSRALSDHPAVSKQTKLLIQDKAREMNYRANHIAAALRKGRSDILGVIVPAIDRTFFASVIRGIEEEADKVGLRVIVCQSYDSSERERDMVETLQRLQVDGIMISTAKDGKNVPQELDVPSVVINDQQGGYAATSHLIRQGYKRIAHLRGPQHLHIYRDRFRGYLDAMRDAGMETPEQYIVDIVSHFDSGKDAFNRLWSLEQRPDAVFSASDYSAAGGIKAAQLLGIRVPDDIAFIGFANEPFTELITPSLSSVDQQTLVMGQRVASRTIEAVKHKNALAISNERLVLAPKIIIRGSSMKSKK